MSANSETLNFSSRRKWRAWLAKNHLAEKEIWLVYDKKLFRDYSISYRSFLGPAVEEAICFGWIDSRVKRMAKQNLGYALLREGREAIGRSITECARRSYCGTVR
jgi:uncharacterized protein YdeI (YjbR/CyaY-like superfamily)